MGSRIGGGRLCHWGAAAVWARGVCGGEGGVGGACGERADATHDGETGADEAVGGADLWARVSGIIWGCVISEIFASGAGFVVS